MAGTIMMRNNPPDARWRSLPCILLTLAGLVSCLDAEPELVVSGVITDTDDAPLAGAVVSIDAQNWATTDISGRFELRGPAEALGSGSITASATGHTAWSLDTSDLTRFTARLQPNSPSANTLVVETARINVAITVPETSAQNRLILASLDNGQIVPYILPAFFDSYELTLTVPVAPGNARTFTLLAPGAAIGEASWWSLPQRVEVNPGTTTFIPADLEPVTTRPVTLEWTNLLQRWPDDTSVTATLTCAPSAGGAPVLVGRSTLEADAPLNIEAFPIPDLGDTCDIFVTLSVPNPRGVIDLVAFERAVTSPWEQTPVPMLVPTFGALLPSADGDTITWPELEDAAIYDVYIALDEGDRVSDPVWSCTTEKTTITLPDLPDAALDQIGIIPNSDYAIRVVARMVPGLDIEDNWNWSTYYGYINSPWVPLPNNALTRWTR